MSKKRSTLPGLLLAVMGLASGCATADSEQPRLICPAIVEYDRATQTAAADELDMLPAGGAVNS